MLPKLPKHWEIQTRLSCAAICGFQLAPRVRSALLRLDDVSLLELYFFLTNLKTINALEKCVSTPFERKQLRTAYLRFYKLLLRSPSGRPTSEKIAWIVPESMLTNRTRINSDAREHINRFLEDRLGEGLWARFTTDCQQWLPYISLGITTIVRRWRTPRINSIRRTMFLLSHALDRERSGLLPWESGFEVSAGRIPIQALYQFEPSTVIRGTIASLNSLDFTLINDLRCFHPDAIALIKSSAGSRAVLSLYRKLNA